MLIEPDKVLSIETWLTSRTEVKMSFVKPLFLLTELHHFSFSITHFVQSETTCATSFNCFFLHWLGGALPTTQQPKDLASAAAMWQGIRLVLLLYLNHGFIADFRYMFLFVLDLYVCDHCDTMSWQLLFWEESWKWFIVTEVFINFRVTLPLLECLVSQRFVINRKKRPMRSRRNRQKLTIFKNSCSSFGTWMLGRL